MADDEVTESGRNKAIMASETPEKEVLENDTRRQDYISSETIMTLFAIAKLPLTESYGGLPRVKELQDLWAENALGAGHAGEILSRISGLLDIEDMLTPKSNFEQRLRSGTLEAMKNGKLSNFVMKYIKERESLDPAPFDSTAVDNIRTVLFIGRSQEMNVSSIQSAFDGFLKLKA